MKKILLANIGNRNLNLDGKPLFQHSDFKGNTVKKFSFQLLNDFEISKNRLSIQIIEELIAQEKQNLQEVILYGSDQQDEAVNDQDTIFVAKILQKILCEKYDDVLFTVRPLKDISVVDNNALLRFYQIELTELSSQFLDAEFIVCDAGGTAQQKSALKIMAEFVLTSQKYRTFYQNIKTNVLEQVEQVEYRRVITQEQITVLVKQGEYNAALSLHQLSSANEHLGRLLQLAAYRREMLTENARQCISLELMQIDPWIIDFKKKKINHAQDSFLDTLFKGHLFAIRERLDWVCYAYQLNNLTVAVLGFQVFMEFFVNALLECELPQFKKASEDRRVGNLLVAYIQQHTPQIETFFGSQIDRVSLPILIKFCQTIAKQKELLELLNELEKCHSWLNKINNINFTGLDELRNRIAHDGQGVTPEKLNKAVEDFPGLLQKARKVLFMPPETAYVSLNALIIKFLRVA